MVITRCGLALSTILLLMNSAATASEPCEADSPEKLLARFSKEFDSSTWRPKPRAYMRPLDDTGWQLRMRTMQALVATGEKATPALIEALKSDDAKMRILAAQTLGYITAPTASAARAALDKALIDALQNDANSTVRLYAVDALGMQRAAGLSDLLAPVQKTEKNGDVRKHVNYALERKGQGVRDEIVSRLISWDSKRMNSAQVGKLAPDFEIQTIAGRAVRLSRFRNESPVVLVFIYGDT